MSRLSRSPTTPTTPARGARRGLSTLPALAVVAVVLLVLLVLAVAFARRGTETDTSAGTTARPTGGGGATTGVRSPSVLTAAELAALPKPTPTIAGFRECPADGDGG